MMNVRSEPLAAPYSEENYRKLLTLMKEQGYRFQSFTLEKLTGRDLFLRHDIDYSMEWAVRFAEINQELDVRATFFLQVRCPLYNLLDFRTRDMARRLVELGQYVGLHVVLPPAPFEADVLRQLVIKDFALLRDTVPEAEPVFAWHNPSTTVEGHDVMEMPLPGFVNVYGDFAGSSPRYVSDSNMRYEVAELEAILGEGVSALQLALAPMQWLPGRTRMIDVMADVMTRHLRSADVSFRDNYVYHRSFPEGLPEELFIGFSHLFRRSVTSREEG